MEAQIIKVKLEWYDDGFCHDCVLYQGDVECNNLCNNGVWETGHFEIVDVIEDNTNWEIVIPTPDKEIKFED